MLSFTIKLQPLLQGCDFILHHPILRDPNNMEGRPFLGLRGNALTTLIVFVAGMEFLYDHAALKKRNVTNAESRLFGYDQGVVGGILTLPSFTNTFPSLCNTSVCLKGMTSVQKSQRSTIQGQSIHVYT